ncbi:MAG: hypothetical protein GF350_03035 [Chitinivibrionales bacterium]|nr:hypothetical protein [Chitinivibrionales bacterium]
MAIRFRGYVRPNVQTDPQGVLEIRFTRPRTARDVTVQVKELDTFIERRGRRRRQISEGSDDDLLATFTGNIRRRKFSVQRHTNASSDASLPTIRVKFQGAAQVYEIPVVAQAGESEGLNWEIAFTVQYPDQDDYTSPVAFIRRANLRVLMPTNTMSDLNRTSNGWETYVNNLYHQFKSAHLGVRVMRGAKSDTSIAHHNASDMNDHAGGMDYHQILNILGDYDLVHFLCHGNIRLDGPLYGQQVNPCMICENRFSHNAFSMCRYRASGAPHNNSCMRTHRGFYNYRLRTNNNASISIAGTTRERLNAVVSTEDLKEIVGNFVDWHEYEDVFGTANAADPNVTSTNVPASTSGGTYTPAHVENQVQLPNSFRFPSLIAFPTGPMRPDFRQNNLPQQPASAYLHHRSAEDVAGVPVICFPGRGGPLSAEVNTTPAASSGTVFPAIIIGNDTEFTSAPTGLQATPGNGHIALSWNPVRGADTYTLYWSTSANVQESTANAIIGIPENSYTHSDTRVWKNDTVPSGAASPLSNGTTYYYKVRARRHRGDMTPSAWGGAGGLNRLNRVKVVYAMCCLAGRKQVMADAVLDAGAKMFIGHQVIIANVASRLVRQFYTQWLRRGARLTNLIDVYRRVVRSSASFTQTRPVIYYRDRSNQTRFWRPSMPAPSAADIKIN